MFYFYTPMKMPKNLWFSDVFRVNRNGILNQNGFISKKQSLFTFLIDGFEQLSLLGKNSIFAFKIISSLDSNSYIFPFFQNTFFAKIA